jgi:hypothetical protein
VSWRRPLALLAALLGACGDDDGAGADAGGADAADDAAGADASPYAGFPCGTTICARGMACCTSDGVGVCIAVNMTCGGETTECDGPEDCLIAPECCQGECLPPDVTCSGARLCHTGADCQSGACCPDGTCGPGC